MPLTLVRPRTERVPVADTIECDDFTVPMWPGLRCSATFIFSGHVEIDHSGDAVTPDGPPSADIKLNSPVRYSIGVPWTEKGIEVELPQWLQDQLTSIDAVEFRLAFLHAIGGQSKLDERAVEIACGC